MHNIDNKNTPLSQDITTLPGDVGEPSKFSFLSFRIREYIGSEIHHIIQCDTGEAEGEVISKLEDLKPGMRVVAWGNMAITIKEINGTEGTGFSSSSMVVLEHGKDDRNCWVAAGVINLRGITRASKSTIVG